MKHTIYYIWIVIIILIASISIFYSNSSISEPEVVYVPTTPMVEPTILPTPLYDKNTNPIINHNTNKCNTLDDIMNDLFDKYAPKRQYKIDTATGSEVYVCSHFGCDMAENLIDAGYDAGVVINWNQHHALTWVEIDDQVYVIEPQRCGVYWAVEDYDNGQNINVVSLQKGREHAKSGSEGLHR